MIGDVAAVALHASFPPGCNHCCMHVRCLRIETKAVFAGLTHRFDAECARSIPQGAVNGTRASLFAHTDPPRNAQHQSKPGTYVSVRVSQNSPAQAAYKRHRESARSLDPDVWVAG